MIVYKTRNSTYEVDPDQSRVRFVEGVNPAPSRIAPDGSWHVFATFSEVDHPAGGSILFVNFADGYFFTTSRVESVQYAPEPFEPEWLG